MVVQGNKWLVKVDQNTLYQQLWDTRMRGDIMSLRQKDLAEQYDVSVEAMNRSIKNLVDLGYLIKVKYNKYKVVSPEITQWL